MYMSYKDQAIRFGITDKKTLNRFKKYLKPQDNGCIEFDVAPWDKRDLYRAFHITFKPEGSTANAQKVKAHRFAYAAFYGFDALPKSDERFSAKSRILHHTCHNKRCVNPQHLEVLTSAQNLLPENRKPNDKDMQ